MTSSRATQRGKILELLIAAQGDWVPLPKIMECAAQYNARIHELRRIGFRIPAPRMEIVAGQRHIWYRLEFTGDQTPRTRDGTSICAALPSTFPEFGDLAPERYPG